ncbi:MAG: hypothetical protein WKF57_14650 [Nakamurella sp.]
MTNSPRWGGQDTALTVIGVLLAIGIGWGAGALVDQSALLSVALEVGVTLGLCLALGFWLRSRMVARGAVIEESARLS